MGVPVFRASKITIFAQGFARFSRPFLLAGAWLSIMIERRYLLVLCANMHRASFLSTKKTQFRRGAKVGSRKRGYQSTEQLAKGMVQLHLAREREMKKQIDVAAAMQTTLHLAREREMKTAHRHRRHSRARGCISPVSGK